MDIRRWNREAWDRKVQEAVPWARPVTPQVMAQARAGNWTIILTPMKAIPESWLGNVQNKEVLCLAGAGGQQAPILAAAGAQVSVLDNSPAMLELDQQVARREGLTIDSHEGDMADLSLFPPEKFDLIVHPVSNCFVPDIRSVWGEAFRVLKPGGVLLSGFMNPAAYIFDFQLAEEKGELRVTHALPYSDLDDLPEEKRKQLLESGEALEFSHTLEDQLAGQLEAGFLLAGFYEDSFSPETEDALTRYMPTMMATRALKPRAE